ncbi:MAG: hypothetical protein ACPKPY_00460 [Nitrososphaeraceae archaeon]
MLGDLIHEGTGRNTSTRVLDTEKSKVEYSAAGKGRLKDIDTTEIVTIWTIPVGENVVYGEGQGIIYPKGGGIVTFKGYGIGITNESGKTSFRGSNFYKTSSTKLSIIDNLVGIFEFEVDQSGNNQVKVWEWK